MKTNAGLYSKDSEKPVSLQGVQITANVIDIAVKTVVAQRFKNTEDVNIEAVYCFPVEDSAAVCGFKITKQNEILYGEIEDVEKAYDMYDDSKEEGSMGIILEQIEPDILNLSIGNLMPGEDVIIEIEYVSELTILKNFLRLQIPTTVSPRYIPAVTDPIKADILSPPYASKVPYGLNIDVNLDITEIEKINSPSHPIEILLTKGKISKVRLSEENASLDRDFILEIASQAIIQPVCTVSKDDMGNKAALIRFFPDLSSYSKKEKHKSEIIFMIDCSGSMSGSSIEEVKTALEQCLKTMKNGDIFNFIRFGSHYELYSDEPVLYTQENVSKALEYVKSIDADLGGTEISEPIKFVMSQKPISGYRKDVILLTDGEVGNESDIVRFAAQKNDDIRFFTFGIGYGASHYLVNGLAKATNGTSEMIQPGENIPEKVLRQFSRINLPYVKNIQIIIENSDYKLQPKLPPIFESFTAFAKIRKFKENSRVVLKGEIGGEKVQWETVLTYKGKDNVIPALWAKNKIDYLENLEQTDKINKKIIKLSKKFNILTSLTSFIAVSKSTEERANKLPEIRRVPITITKDYVDYENVKCSLMISDETKSLYKMLVQDVDAMNLSDRANNCFNHANIRLIGELCSKTESEMRNDINFDRESLDEIIAKLESMGLSLGMTFSETINEALLTEIEMLEIAEKEDGE